MRNLIILLFISLSLTVYSQELPDSKIVIEKYLDATKIQNNYKSINDIVFSYTAESQRGVAETEMKFAFPFKSSMSVFSNGMEIMGSKYDGNKLKRKSGFGGGNNQAPKEGKEALNEALRSHPFLEANFDEYGITHKTIAIEKVNDKDAYCVEITFPDGKTYKDYFDVQSGLKVKTFSINDTPRGKFESSTFYEDYKAFKGSEILFASKRKQNSQMGEIVSELQTVKTNKGFKEKDFAID